MGLLRPDRRYGLGRWPPTGATALVAFWIIAACAVGADPVVDAPTSLGSHETKRTAAEPTTGAISPGELATSEPGATPIGRGSTDPTVTASAAPVVEPGPSPTGVAEAPSPDLDTGPAIAAAPDFARSRPAAPNGRAAPWAPLSPGEAVDQLAAARSILTDPTATEADRADAGHLHQVAIRKLGYRPDWDVDVFANLPPESVEPTLLHVSARRALYELHSGFAAADFVPAWAIVEPAPLDELRSYYNAAEAATGIEWEYLASINLIETGMGRIRGLSSAGAQGPMQFLPSTWAEPGIGEGDIDNPGDAIAAAARYLVRRGGPDDMAAALWGYNNSDSYVTAVQAYAELLRNDPTELVAIHHWEIYFATDEGDVWLPTGFSTDEVLDLDAYLTDNPWSVPDPALAPPVQESP